MAFVRVPIHRTSPTQTVQVEAGATAGAVFGVNLRWPNGRIVQASDFTTSAPSGGSSITTTDDIDEGQWHLWFTPRRAQDAVGDILADSDDIALRYVPGTSITATLADLPDSGAGTLLAITRDSKGRITGTRAATITGTPDQIDVANGNASSGLPTISLDPAILSQLVAWTQLQADLLISSNGAPLVTSGGDFITTSAA